MRLVPILAVGLLAGCGRPADEPEARRPAGGDVSTPDEEFRLARDAAGRLAWELADTPPADRVAVVKALSAAQKEAGRLGYAVGLAEPHTRLGADALFAYLFYGMSTPERYRQVLDLAARHHPDDPRLAEHLSEVVAHLRAGVSDWLAPTLDRLLTVSGNPAVRQVAADARGKLAA